MKKLIVSGMASLLLLSSTYSSAAQSDKNAPQSVQKQGKVACEHPPQPPKDKNGHPLPPPKNDHKGQSPKDSQRHDHKQECPPQPQKM